MLNERSHTWPRKKHRVHLCVEPEPTGEHLTWCGRKMYFIEYWSANIDEVNCSNCSRLFYYRKFLRRDPIEPIVEE